MVSEMYVAIKLHWRRFCEPCVRVAREYSQRGNSPKSALRRRSPKNRAHFRRATHRTITPSTLSDGSNCFRPSVDRAHVLQSLRVRGAPILHQTRRKIARLRRKFRKISAQFGAERAPKVRHKHAINALMFFVIVGATQMPLRRLSEPRA